MALEKIKHVVDSHKEVPLGLNSITLSQSLNDPLISRLGDTVNYL